MIESENGNGVLMAPHKLVICFDPKTQQIGLEFDSKEFRTWDYIVGMLTAATEAARDFKRQNQIAAMQQQVAQQQALEMQAHKELNAISRQQRR